MASSKRKSKRKVTGGRYRPFSGKKKFELINAAVNTKLSSDLKKRTNRTLGGNERLVTLTTNLINVLDKKGKAQKTEILNVVENPANPHLVRRNIITKGAIVETKLGKAKVTSRPGQEGSLNGILLA